MHSEFEITVNEIGNDKDKELVKSIEETKIINNILNIISIKKSY